jgi:hypothetical protein
MGEVGIEGGWKMRTTAQPEEEQVPMLYSIIRV